MHRRMHLWMLDACAAAHFLRCNVSRHVNLTANFYRNEEKRCISNAHASVVDGRHIHFYSQQQQRWWWWWRRMHTYWWRNGDPNGDDPKRN